MKRSSGIAAALLSLLAARSITMYAQTEGDIDAKVNALLSRMTLGEKISMLAGTGFDSKPVPRLGIPTLRMSDGPVGVRWDRSTAFPASIAMGATWDPALIHRLGEAIGIETRAKGRSMILGPCININRVPVGGRSFESFGEDPWLMARMAVGYIRGVQSQHVIATAKHYAANNQEFERTTIDEKVDERTLREIYLPAFHAAVREAGVLSVMSAYNKLNGLWCSENPWLLTDVLKKEWGFRGFVVSDWGAVHSTVPTANAGLDIEMPQGDFLNDSLLVPAVRRHEVTEQVIDDKVRRLLRAMEVIGLFDAPPSPDPAAVNSPEHRALAREVEAEGIVLLQNRNGVLPIDVKSTRTIAVIGPGAAVARTGGGGSAYVTPFYGVSPLEGVTAAVKGRAAVTTAPGCAMDQDVTPVPSSWLRPPAPDAGTTGLRGEYFANQDFTGTPALTRIDARVDFDWGSGSPDRAIPADHFSARWTGALVPQESGEFQLSIRSDDGSRLYVNGGLFIDNWGDHAGVTKSRPITLTKGTPVDLRLEYYENDGGALVQLGLTSRSNDMLASAVELARKSDIAIVCVGNSNEVETEGIDRSSLALPAGQDDLVAAIAAANPRTVVVLTTGSPVLMPWAGSVGAIVQAWFGGQEVGNALADVLTGAVSPSGKLPVTFPRSWDDTPARATYPGRDGRTEYAEGIFVGYRFFDREKKDVLFPFGHGLSYTTFAYGPLALAPVQGGTPHAREVSVEITNTGKREGAEVVQLYVGERNPPVPRPPAELKAFARVVLAPGEKKTVRMTLDESSFAYYNTEAKGWTVAPGTYDILVGSSSRDIRSRASVEFR